MTHSPNVDWSTLIVEVKQHIVGLLDYESRCHLRTCSKQDKLLVDSTRFIAKTFEIAELWSNLQSDKTIIRVNIDSFTIWFIGRNDVTKVDRAWKNKEIIEEWSERKEENRYEVARRFLEKYSDNGLIEAETIKLEDLTMGPSENWRLKCDRLKVMFTMNDDINWLMKCEPELKELEVGRLHADTIAIADVPHLWTVSDSLIMYSDVRMTDEQLGQVKATHLRIISNRITIEGATKALERFLKYGKKTDSFLLMAEIENEFNPLQLIPKNVRIQKEKQPYEGTNDYHGKILGGFPNVHGHHDDRRFNCYFHGVIVEISCDSQEIHKDPCVMYPFT